MKPGIDWLLSATWSSPSPVAVALLPLSYLVVFAYLSRARPDRRPGLPAGPRLPRLPFPLRSNEMMRAGCRLCARAGLFLWLIGVLFVTINLFSISASGPLILCHRRELLDTQSTAHWADILRNIVAFDFFDFFLNFNFQLSISTWGLLDMCSVSFWPANFETNLQCISLEGGCQKRGPASVSELSWIKGHETSCWK